MKLIAHANLENKINLDFFNDFKKYVGFKQECWYTQDQLFRHTEKKLHEGNNDSRIDKIVQNFQHRYSHNPESLYF